MRLEDLLYHFAPLMQPHRAPKPIYYHNLSSYPSSYYYYYIIILYGVCGCCAPIAVHPIVRICNMGVRCEFWGGMGGEHK